MEVVLNTIQCIPNFWEQKGELKVAFPNFGNWNEKFIPNFWEQEWEAGIPGNGGEQECHPDNPRKFEIFS